MERDRILRFTPVDHPDSRVQRVGFDLRRLEATVRVGETGPELARLIAFKGKPPEKPPAATDNPSGATDNPTAPRGQPTTPGTSVADPQETMPQS